MLRDFPHCTGSLPDTVSRLKDLGSRIPNSCIALILLIFLFPRDPAAVGCSSLTVSDSEAQHILIRKFLTQQVLLAISPSG